jgi:hypothetical protein
MGETLNARVGTFGMLYKIEVLTKIAQPMVAQPMLVVRPGRAE